VRSGASGRCEWREPTGVGELDACCRAHASVLEGVDKLPAVVLARCGDGGALSIEAEAAAGLFGGRDADICDGGPRCVAHDGPGL
jgi:hypothetical protein